MGFNSAFKGLKLLKNPGNGRLNNLNDAVLNALKVTRILRRTTVLIFRQSSADIMKIFVFYKQKYEFFSPKMFASFFCMAVYSTKVQRRNNAQIGQLKYAYIHIIKTNFEPK